MPEEIKKPQMSNEDMLAAALISLAPGLLGAAISPKDAKYSAMGGVAAGTDAASKWLGTQATQDAAKLKQQQDWDDFARKEMFKAKLNPKEDLETFRQKEQIRQDAKPPKAPDKLRPTSLTDSEGNPLVWDPNTQQYVKAKAPSGGVEKQGESQKQVEKLGKDLATSSDLFQAISNIESDAGLGFKLEDFDEKTGKVNGKDVDIPGVSIPLVGRVGAYSSDARSLESMIGEVVNKRIKDQSGATVTNQEMERIRIEFAAGKYNTEPEMLGALKRFKAAAIQAAKGIEAKYPPKTVEKYGSRGGVTTKNFQKGPTAKKPITEMTPEELEAELGE